MDIKDELLKEHSKKNALSVARWAEKDPRNFHLLMDVFLSGPYRLTQRASWPVNLCVENQPEIIQPYMERMLVLLEQPVHSAVKRNTMRLLQFIEIPDELLGKVAEIAFQFLGSSAEPVAVKVFSMTVLSNICQKEPDLKNELRLHIEEQMPYGSPGFVSRGKRILRELT